uniref:Transmembrane protein 14C n=1 Tax=Parascaris univalens TaxID=6257 RepID=A0A915BSB2_PARUN
MIPFRCECFLDLIFHDCCAGVKFCIVDDIRCSETTFRGIYFVLSANVCKHL